jgi:hypothetical protein
MLTESIKSTIEVLKLAPRYLAALAVIAGALIFFPAEWLAVLGLQAFSIEHRAWIGLALLGSVGICSVSALIWVGESIRGAIRRRGVRRFVCDKLNRLTEDEKQILRYYFANGTRSNTLRINDGVVQELVACRIIRRSAQFGNLLEGFSHNISDFAWDYIHENPGVLAGTTNTYRTDKSDFSW